MFTDAFNLLNDLPKIKEFSDTYYLSYLIPLFIIAVTLITYFTNMSNSFLKLVTAVKESKLIISLIILTVAIIIFDMLIAYLLLILGEMIRYSLRLLPNVFSLTEINAIVEQLHYFTIALSLLFILVFFILLLLVYMTNDALILHNLKSVSSKNLEVFRQKNKNRLEYYDHLSEIYNKSLSEIYNGTIDHNKFVSKLVGLHPDIKHYFQFRQLKKSIKIDLNDKNRILNRKKLKYLPVTKIFRFMNFILLFLIALVISFILLEFSSINIRQDYNVIFAMVSLLFVQIFISKAMRLFD
ncbi:hypothetical protein [Salinicoccus sp. HZC-1]|uniref:hypothetical protein n=1 Tax=Salinicoccus sp. HZC-1 TaxID=3385497 RepID=UPI00398A6BC5